MINRNENHARTQLELACQTKETRFMTKRNAKIDDYVYDCV